MDNLEQTVMYEDIKMVTEKYFSERHTSFFKNKDKNRYYLALSDIGH